MQTNDDCILLLQKQLTDEITPTEQVLLSKWLQQSPDHQQLAEEIRLIWEKTGTYEAVFTPNLEADFRQLQSRIRREEMAPVHRPASMGRIWLRAAAVVALLVASVWTWRNVSALDADRMVISAVGQEKLSVHLPDGSQVWLRRDAQLEYPPKFEGKERHVKLAGEAYFEVAHNAAQPFVVDLPDGDQVRVLGTAFGIRIAPDQHRTDVTVRSGRVLFAPKNKPEGVILTARQQATYDKTSEKIVLNQNITLNELAWQAGGLAFVSTPLSQVVSDLEQYYHVKITLLNPALKGCSHTAPLTNQPFNKVLESLALTYQLRVTETAPGQFELSGGACE